MVESRELRGRAVGTPAMSTNIEMVVVEPTNLRRYLGLIVAGDLPAFQEMLNHTCLNVSSPQVEDGRTPLHMAALKKKLEIAKLILNSPGVSVQVVNAKDCFGYTPLHLAVRSGDVDLVRLLAESPLSTLDVAATSKKGDDDKDCDGWTPLHLAAREGNVCIVKILLQNFSNGRDNKPINIHATNWQGESALDIAKQSNHDSELVEILECFDANWLQLERQKSANSINAILVGATVLATVTYTTLMQPPVAGLPAQENSLTGI